MHLETISAGPGQKASGLVDLTVAGQQLALPVTLINGSDDGPRLTVTAGIHGGEYPCVDAAVRLGAQVEPGRLRGQLTIIHSANPLAFAARSIYVTPIDGKNLNRQFPGDPAGTFTEAWADWLFRHVILPSDAYIDLHGGDMIEALVPFVAYDVSGSAKVDDTAKQMAEAFGIRYALARRTTGGPSGTTMSAAAHAGVPALLAEAGGQGVLDEASTEILRSGVVRVLKEFGMIDSRLAAELAPAPPERIEWLEGWSWLRSDVDGLFYPGIRVGEFVEKGQPLGRLADFFGRTLREVEAPATGIVLFLVTSLAMNEGDPLLAVAF